MSNRYCNRCGVQTATDEMEFEIGTAMGVSQEARIEELNSLSECPQCREERIYESVRKEMQEDSGYYLCKHGFHEGEDCSICEHDDGKHVDDFEPEYPCPLCEHPNMDRQSNEDLFVELMNSYNECTN